MESVDGRLMTVVTLNGDEAICRWLEGSNVQEDGFKVDSILPVDWNTGRCVLKYMLWYPQYLGLLKLAKAAGLLRDRLHAHGVLNDGIPAMENVLGQAGPLGAIVLAGMDIRCLKSGIDDVFG